MASSCKPKGSATRGGALPEACVADIDPKHELHDSAHSYIICLSLPGFKKEDFKVQVDSGGLLTVRGERPAGYVRFNKSFKLPQTANHDGIAGRFDGTVLSLTVPKQAVSGADMVKARLTEVQEEECAAAAQAERMTWAEALGGKGQVVAAAVAGVALGAFLAHRLLSATNSE